NNDLSGKLNHFGFREMDAVHSTDGVSPTLNTMQGGNRQPKIAIREATKKGYTVAEPGDSVNISFPDSETRRGRVGKQTANTLLTGEEQGVVLGGNNDDKNKERNTFEVLSILQEKIGEKKVAEWRFRILDTFQ